MLNSGAEMCGGRGDLGYKLDRSLSQRFGEVTRSTAPGVLTLLRGCEFTRYPSKLNADLPTHVAMVARR
jgi:hypothetical protein